LVIHAFATGKSADCHCWSCQTCSPPPPAGRPFCQLQEPIQTLPLAEGSMAKAVEVVTPALYGKVKPATPIGVITHELPLNLRRSTAVASQRLPAESYWKAGVGSGEVSICAASVQPCMLLYSVQVPSVYAAITAPLLRSCQIRPLASTPKISMILRSSVDCWAGSCTWIMP
jgi:hypothetical protein